MARSGRVGGENEDIRVADGDVEEFDDFIPIMAQKLGGQGLMEELCKGFQLLADPQTNTITLESLKKNGQMLGLEGMTNDQLQAMIEQGDLDRDGALNQMEFCIIMVRLSPSLMCEALEWLEDSLEEECFMEESY